MTQSPFDMFANPRNAIPRSGSAWLLVAANCVPIIGIVALDWSLLSVMLLFWAESAIIGAVNVIKMVKIEPAKGMALGAFFTVHYGIFMLVHAVFILSFFAPESDSFGFGVERVFTYLRPASVGLVALLVSHGYSLKRNFFDGHEYARTTVDKQMFAPYKRIMLMHFTLIAGGWIMMTLKAPMLIVVLLVALKICADLVAHNLEHAKRNEPQL